MQNCKSGSYLPLTVIAALALISAASIAAAQNNDELSGTIARTRIKEESRWRFMCSASRFSFGWKQYIKQACKQLVVCH